MTNVLDHALVALLVTISFAVTLYSLSPARTKKWMLSQVARYLGLRAMLAITPKQCGCDGCSVANSRSALNDELKKKALEAPR